MKAYTDLEQSRKLAEILPLESADMCYYEYTSHIDGTPKVGYKEGITEGIPCWSLAALLELMPPYLFEFDRGIDLNVYPNLNSKGWHCGYMPNAVENMKTDKFRLITSEDSLTDACYEMIIKLHEQKIL